MTENNRQAWVSIPITKITGSTTLVTDEPVVIEQALTVYLNNQEFVTLVCSPGNERALITGLLLSEGIIAHQSDLTGISLDFNDGYAWVETSTQTTLSEKLFLKRYLTSCCGKGRSLFYFANDARTTKTNTSSLKITPQQVSSYTAMLEGNSDLFQLTGGVHSGALILDDAIRFSAFDIGRHNVLDKLYGLAFAEAAGLSDAVLVFSGRISSEILIKTAKMGCPIIVGRSAPTDLALSLATELGITVIGFARQDRMNIYTHSERISY